MKSALVVIDSQWRAPGGAGFQGDPAPQPLSWISGRPEEHARAGCVVNGLRRPPGPRRQRGRGFLWSRGGSSRVRPRGAPSRLPARPGVPGTTRYRVSRRISGTRVPRLPGALGTRSNNHGPRRSPDKGRDDSRPTRRHPARPCSAASQLGPLRHGSPAPTPLEPVRSKGAATPLTRRALTMRMSKSRTVSCGNDIVG